VPPPPVFFVRVANKGLMLDAASRLGDTGFRVAMFSVICGWLVRVADKRVTAGRFAGLERNGEESEPRQGVGKSLCALFTAYYNMLVLFVNK
jgi:hypothetical protein